MGETCRVSTSTYVTALSLPTIRRGSNLQTTPAARRKAVESLRGVMSGDLLMGDLNTASFIEIEDDLHELIETVSFEAFRQQAVGG